ncbi:MAG: arginine--tRNA ligase [Alphaproteobacteria bacterium]|nr:MAG: arginine--tRNA ligase [Alphaproteobacteria bacterium]
MNIYQTWTEIVRQHAESVLSKLSTDVDKKIVDRVMVEPPRDSMHGHLATNAAMVLAKSVGMSPRDFADKLVPYFYEESYVSGVEVAGPGFINICLSSDFWNQQVKTVLCAQENYASTALGAGKLVNIEYVSCNPTGPMHIGHARGAIVGDVLANIYEAVGYTVTREFYINDAGQQIKALGESLYKQYRELCGIPYEKDVAYPGDYLIAAAKDIFDADNNKWADVTEDMWLPEFSVRAVRAMMVLIRQDLKKLGICHRIFSSEKALVEQGKVQKAIKTLDGMGLLYRGILPQPKGHADDDWEPREQLLFKSTAFGDDTDRPLMKSDGTYTYFTSDIAYHQDKYARGHHILIDILGADHGGYVTRIKSAVKAITGGNAQCHVLLCQMVKFIKDGTALKMSKRAGTFVTVDDVLAEVPKDVVRFMMLTRKNDAPLDFDFTKVVEQSKENPVFYVQYAHARMCSIFRHAQELFGDLEKGLIAGDVSMSEDEQDVIRFVCQWPQVLQASATANEPHRIAYYLYELASQFHALWNKGKDYEHLRFIHPTSKEKTLERLQVVRVVQVVLAQGLGVLGIIPVEEMR